MGYAMLEIPLFFSYRVTSRGDVLLGAVTLRDRDAVVRRSTTVRVIQYADVNDRSRFSDDSSNQSRVLIASTAFVLGLVGIACAYLLLHAVPSN